MSISDREMKQEVAEIVEQRIKDGEVTITSWLVMEIISRHEDITGDDADWYRVCAKAHMKGVVGQVVRRYKPSEEEEADRQIIMPGCERLQLAYSVDRDGPAIVPIDQLTIDEIDAKIAELSGMRAGLSQHIRELERYREQRIGAFTG